MQVKDSTAQVGDPELHDQNQLQLNKGFICKEQLEFQNLGQTMRTNDMEHMNFSSPWNRSDIVLLVGDKEFHVHRCILSHWSPVFELMFNADFREKYESEIRLNNKKSDQIQEMLEVIYDRRKKITDDNYAFLLQLADEFQMDQLLEECRKFLMDVDKSGTKSLKYIETTNYINMEDIRAKCITAAKEIPSDILSQCSHYHNLDFQSRIDITSARLEMLEDIVKKYESTCNFLLEYLFESAHAEYQSFLREHGLEETQIAKCENLEKHRKEYHDFTKRFYLHCATCRHKINAVDKFTVSTKDLMNSLQQMYDLIFND